MWGPRGEGDASAAEKESPRWPGIVASTGLLEPYFSALPNSVKLDYLDSELPQTTGLYLVKMILQCLILGS